MPITDEIQLGRVSLAEQAYRILKSQILGCNLSPGEKLDIFQLSEQFKVSRTPIKEALNRLAQEGLLEIRPQSGTFVAPIDPRDIEHVFDIRLMIELWAAGTAADRPEFLNLKTMSQMVDKCDSLLASERSFDFPKFADADFAFHSQIVLASRNPRLEVIYTSLNHKVPVMRFFWDEVRTRSLKSHQEHIRILRAFERAKKGQVLQALRSHILGSRREILRRAVVAKVA